MRFWFRRKKINLDTRGQIEVATGKLNEAFIMFQQAHDAVDEAQNELSATIIESEKKAESLKAKLETELREQQLARDAMLANEGLKERLQQFLLK